MDPWLAVSLGVDVVTLWLVVRISITVQNHQHVTVRLSQRFGTTVWVGEDK